MELRYFCPGIFQKLLKIFQILEMDLYPKKWIFWNSVRILSGFWEKTVRCLSVRPKDDETELFRLSLSLSAEILVKFEETI